MYTLREDVVFQKDFRIGEDSSILAYLARPDAQIFAADEPVSVVVSGEQMYELNLTASLILEGWLADWSEQQIAIILSRIFRLTIDTAVEKVQYFTDNLVELKVLERKA